MHLCGDMIVGVYVDDIIIGGKAEKEVVHDFQASSGQTI